MMRKILTMCSVLLLVPLAADAVEVKLINTGRMTWNILDYGYWIEYEIDGKRFRSDTDAGQRTNQLAWELMSEEDKLKVIKAYGMGGSKARIEQFGTDGAQKIADKVNDDAGWTEAWKVFADRLAMRDFPTLEAIFRNDETRSAYFSDNYAEEWAVDSVPEYTDEMRQLQAEQKLVWGWACTTYEAIKTANEKRIQTAVQALSGDLIALICDKVLVPNITFENPIELGFKYGFRKEVLGSLLDYVNSISQAGDKLVESVLGERASGESGAEIIAKLTDMVNMDLHFISQCRQRLSQNKAEIERLGAEALKKKREADAARSKALAPFAEERKKGEPTGEPADEGIRQANAEYRSQIDLLVKQLEKTTDEEKRKDLEAEIAETDADKTGYNQQLLANLDAAFLKWYNACLAEYTSWTNSDPIVKNIVVLSRYASDVLAGSSAYAGPSAYDISDAEAEGVVSEMKAHIGRLKAAHAELPKWVKTGNELVETYRSSYDALLSDLHAVDQTGCHVTEVGRDLADSLLKRLSSVGGVASVEQASCQAAIDRCESRVQRYIEARALKKECEAEFAAKRAEILASVQLAVIEYVNANGVLTNQLANPPAFLAGLSTTYGMLNPIPQSSKLWQDIYGGNPNGNAAKMRQYCRELNDYYIQYLSNRQKVDDAYNNVLSYVSACRSHGISMFNEAGWVDLRIMPPACYETLDLVKALIRDFNVQDREGKLLEYYALLANNEDYYAEKRDQFVRAVKSSVRQSANVSAEELPTYAQICSGIVSLMNNPTGFADGIKGYSPDEAGGVFDLLITPIQSAIEGRRNALSWYYSIEGGQAKVFGVEGEVSGTVVIPEAFEGSPVTELGDYLFTGSAMTAVVIPESVVKIGSCAFSACRQLGAVRIPAKVASIGEWAFAGCDTLMKFEVAADNAAYRAVNGLLFAKGGTDPIAGIGGDVTVPPGVKRIGTEVFYERSLGSVVLPPGVVEIGERAFAYSTLREITIPASVTTIAGYAFYSCDQLVTVYVDKGDNDRVRELLRDAGASLSRITIVSEFTETVDGIEWSYATANGEAVVTWIAEKPEGESYGKVVVPSKLGGLAVTGIGNSVFMWRSDITEVVIPQGVRSIGDYAFNSSPSIKTVTLPRSLTQVGNLTFAYSSLTTVRTAPGDTARMKSLMTKGGLSVSVNWVESDDPAERPEIVEPPVEPIVYWLYDDESVIIHKDEVAPYAVVATVYDGYLRDVNGVVKGTIQVKVAKGKVDRKTGEFSSMVTATVQPADGSKKISFKNGIADEYGNVTEMADKSGNVLAVSLGANGLGGTFRRAGESASCQVDGARNLFSAKDADSKAVAAAIEKMWVGAVNVVGDGLSLAVSIAKKGKVKVSGTVGGAKVSATSQLLVGDGGVCCVPVVIAKKARLAFNLWLLEDGTVGVAGLEGVEAGKAGKLAPGAKFDMGDGADRLARALADKGTLYSEYLPDGLAVAQNGSKWVVAPDEKGKAAKAGKVAFNRKTGAVDETKLGANPSALKLTYTSKSGSFKGSFKAYSLEKGKVKSYTVSVTGVMVGNVGYGTATLKKPAVSWSIIIE